MTRHGHASARERSSSGLSPRYAWAMEQEGRVRTFGHLGFSDEVVVHDGDRTRTVVRATLVRRPDDTPHSVQLSIDRYERASKRDPWPPTPTKHIPLDGPAFDATFAHMAAWKDLLPHGRSTRYVTLMVDDDRLDTTGVLELLADSGATREPFSRCFGCCRKMTSRRSKPPATLHGCAEVDRSLWS